MSLNRFVYYSAVAGGWAAFLAWLVAASLFGGTLAGGSGRVALVGTLVGAFIGAALNLVAGMANAQWKRHLRRAVPGLVVGGIGGAVGGLVGNLVYVGLGLPRALGWMVMGLGIGSADGLCDASPRKLRNGLAGGALGGFVGGLLFDAMLRVALSASGTTACATAFVILGAAIGATIGLAQVVLKEAWLTVVDGFRPGRQLILAQTVTVLGRGDHLPLPLLGYPGRDLEAEHLTITRRPDGRHVIQDNGSRIGTRVNGRLIEGPVILADGDLIKLGTNIVRFNQRRRGDREGPVPQTDRSHGTGGGIAPPPPPPGDVPVRGAGATPACPPSQPPAPAPQAPLRPPGHPSSQGPPAPAPETSDRPAAPRIPPPPPPPG